MSKDFLTEEAIYESNKIKEIEQKTNRDDLIYKTIAKKKNRKNDLQELKTIRSFRRETPNDELTLEDALEEEIKFKNEIDKFKESAKLKKTKQKRKKKTFKSENRLLKVRQKPLNGCEIGTFPAKKTDKEKDIF